MIFQFIWTHFTSTHLPLFFKAFILWLNASGELLVSCMYTDWNDFMYFCLLEMLSCHLFFEFLMICNFCTWAEMAIINSTKWYSTIPQLIKNVQKHICSEYKNIEWYPGNKKKIRENGYTRMKCQLFSTKFCIKFKGIVRRKWKYPFNQNIPFIENFNWNE